MTEFLLAEIQQSAVFFSCSWNFDQPFASNCISFFTRTLYLLCNRVFSLLFSLLQGSLYSSFYFLVIFPFLFFFFFFFFFFFCRRHTILSKSTVWTFLFILTLFFCVTWVLFRCTLPMLIVLCKPPSNVYIFDIWSIFRRAGIYCSALSRQKPIFTSLGLWGWLDVSL